MSYYIRGITLKYVFTLLFIFSTFITGCSNQMESEEQNIIVEKRTAETNHYEDFKVIKTIEKVQKVRDILSKADWVEAKVNMAHNADYRFRFEYKDSEKIAKAVLYELWISPNKDQVELAINASSEYVQLDKNSSAKLYKILTDRK